MGVDHLQAGHHTGSDHLGQIIGGVLGDRWSKTIVAAVGMLGHCCAMLLFAFTDSSTGIVIAAIIHGFSWGARGPLMMAIRADFYGRQHFATIAGFSTLEIFVNEESEGLPVPIDFVLTKE